MEGGTVLTILRSLLYLGFLTWTGITFFQSDSEISRANRNLKIRNKLFHKSRNPLLSPEKTNIKRGVFESDKFYCPTTGKANLTFMSFHENRYFLILQTNFNSFPKNETKLLETGTYLEKDGEVWLVDSLGKTLKRLKIEVRRLSSEGPTTVLNHLGEFLSHQYCQNFDTKDLEGLKKILLGEYFPTKL